jgi:hypothetical protein
VEYRQHGLEYRQHRYVDWKGQKQTLERKDSRVGKKETTSLLYFIRELRQAFTAV